MTTALTRIHVTGFRSLRDVELAPGRVTVLIGPNGSGKSNLLAFLRMLALTHTHSLRVFVGEAGGASALLHYGPKVTTEISFALDFQQEGHFNRYSARLGYAAGDTLIFLDEVVAHRIAENQDFRTFSLGAGHSESLLPEAAEDPTRGTERAVRWWISRLNYFHFHDTSATSFLRSHARRDDSRYLRSNGSNLASYLLALRESDRAEDRKAWQRINRLVRQVAPFIKTLEPSVVGPSGLAGLFLQDTRGQAVRLDWIDERDVTFSSGDFSDGTLRAIALITALAQPSDRLPLFISIDEPELGLHPAAIGLLADLIKSVSGRCQILLATQSPALLDLFDLEEVVVAERKDAATSFRRLPREEFEPWLQDYALSELYDKNVLGGRP